MNKEWLDPNGEINPIYAGVWALNKLGYKDDYILEFFQEVDFFIPSLNIGIRIVGKFEKELPDFLTGIGIQIIDIKEEELTSDPIRYIREALSGYGG